MWSSEAKEIKHTRKPHVCEFCERIIEVGECAKSMFYVDEMAHYNIYLCDWCAKNINDIVEGEWGFGELFESVHDALGRQICEFCNGKDTEFELDTKRGVVVIKCNNFKCAESWEIELDTLFDRQYHAW